MVENEVFVRQRRLSFLLIALTLVCACTPGQDEGNLVVAFEPGALTGPTADPGTPMTDDSGYARLDWFPAFLVVTVEAEDLDAPVIETWPTLVPETNPEVVTLEVDVPAGTARRLTVEVLVANDGGDTSTFVDPPPSGAEKELEIVAGQVTDVEVELQELQYGTVTATVSPLELVEGVSWVDDRAGAVLPALSPTDGAVEYELAVGRVYWPRIIDSDGNSVDFPMQTVSLSTEGQTREITLELEQQ